MQGLVCEFMTRSDLKTTKHSFCGIVAYPQNNISDIISIMKDLKVDNIPVFQSPWRKKIVGIIKRNKIKYLLDD